MRSASFRARGVSLGFGGVFPQYTYLRVFVCISNVLVRIRTLRPNTNQYVHNTQPNTLDTMYQSVDMYWMRWGAVIHRQYEQILARYIVLSPEMLLLLLSRMGIKFGASFKFVEVCGTRDGSKLVLLAKILGLW